MSEELMMELIVWHEGLASKYMCCPVNVPQSRGGLFPDGLVMVRVSSAQFPLIPAVVEAADITNFSKSILLYFFLLINIAHMD